MSERALRRPRLLMVALAAAALFATTLLPATSSTAAPQKIFTLTVAPSTAVAGSSVAFDVTMTNKSPGNSNPSSFAITIPQQFSLDPNTPAEIVGASDPANLSVIPTSVGSTVKVQGLGPVKSNQFVTVRITVSTPSVTGCQPVGSYQWTADVRAGTSLTGDAFFPATGSQNPPYPPTVSLIGTSAATQLAITTVFDEQVGTEILSADTPPNFLARPSTSFPFTVVVEAQDDSGAEAPVCGNTTVRLSVDGDGTLSEKALANGTSSLTFSGLTFDNSGVVVLRATDTSPGALDDGTARVDFNDSLEVKAGRPGVADSLTTSGTCTPTADTPFCVTWTLPNGWSQTAALFVQDCPPELQCNFGLLAAFVANLKNGTVPLYHNSAPFDFFTLDIGCDRSICSGGRLSRYVIFIDPDDLATEFDYIASPACTPSVKDFIAPYNTVPGQTFCTDYSGAHRDNNQDTFWQVRAADIDGRGKM